LLNDFYKCELLKQESTDGALRDFLKQEIKSDTFVKRAQLRLTTCPRGALYSWLLGILITWYLGAWGSARCSARLTHIALALQTLRVCLFGLGQRRRQGTVRRNIDSLLLSY
jgi:hypothetical protein